MLFQKLELASLASLEEGEPVLIKNRLYLAKLGGIDMSTKVYTAYKLRNPDKFWDFVRDVVPRGHAAVRKSLRKLYTELIPCVDRRKKMYKDALARWEHDEKARLAAVRKLVLEQAKEADATTQWSPIDLRVEIGVWEHRKQLYLIPFCNGAMRNSLDFLKEHPVLDDFRYWNNTDEPEGMSRREWAKRGRVWDAIRKEGWQNHTVIGISSWNSTYLFDPFLDMMNEIDKILKEKGK